MPGYDVHILHADGDPCQPGEEGVVCLRLPLPPGTLPTLWGDDARYQASYLCEHPGYYLTGDGGYLDDDGYLFVMGRVDDVINVAGHRLSTGAIESVRRRRRGTAEDALGQDTAQDDARHRPRQGRTHALDDRGSCGAPRAATDPAAQCVRVSGEIECDVE